MSLETASRELIVIVGATGSFGQAIVAKMLSMDLDVLAIARHPDALRRLQTLYPRIRTCVADISQDDAIQSICAHLTAPVRAIVHGPGVAVAGGIVSAPTQALVDAVNIKVGGFVRLVRAVDQYLLPGSRLIAIGGHYGFEPTAYAAAAGVANAALANVVRQFSLAYGTRGITVHLIAPGPADTERLRAVAAQRALLEGISVEAVLDQFKADSSLHAFTTPEQVAWMVAVLLAPEASSMTGSAVMLDAGRRRGLP